MAKKKRGPDIIDRIADAISGSDETPIHPQDVDSPPGGPKLPDQPGEIPMPPLPLPEEKPLPWPDHPPPLDPGKPLPRPTANTTPTIPVVEPGKPVTLADRIIRAMVKKGYKVHVGDDLVNIIYVEGMNIDGKPNGNPPNKFNDIRCAIRVRNDGTTDMLGIWDATTEPGWYYTANRINSEGAARIALGQQKAWVVGYHQHKRNHLALRQDGGKVKVHRDDNEDFKRTGDNLDYGNFGINQHGGYDFPHDNIKTASAGCLVGRTMKGHFQFMEVVKSDARYKANKNYVFDTTILEAKDVD